MKEIGLLSSRSLITKTALLLIYHPRRAKKKKQQKTELEKKHKVTTALSHQFLKTEKSREDVSVGVSQMFGFFHHLKHISLSILVQRLHSGKKDCLNHCGKN